MVDLIPKNTDEEMLRYQEAERMLRARIPMKNNAALVYEADPITGRENAYSRLPSGGYVKIGDRAVTPVEAAKADAMVAAPMAADIDSFSRDYKTNFGSNPVMEDYLAANFTEAQTREYFAQRQVESLSQPGMQVPVKLNPEQIQMGVDVGAPMTAPQAVTNRESFTDFLAGSGQSEASKFLSQVYEAIGLDSYESRRIAEAVMGNPNATRDIGIGLVDLTPAGLFFGAEEGYNTFLQGYNAGDPMTAGLGALEAGLSVLEAAPLTGAGIKALRTSITPAMRQAINTLKADAIGAGRAIAQGDTEMLGEVFQRGRPPQSLSAGAADTSYRMQQQPRGPEDDLPIRLDDLTKSTTGENAGYPADFYSANGPRFYAPGPQFAGDEFGQANRESYKAIMAVRGKPDAEVTIYRAVPDDPKITTINRGDFVTLSPTYAKLHGGSGYGPKGEDAGKILSEKVKVKDIYFDGNDVNEFGYFPEEAAQGSVGKDILELNLKAQPRLAELFKNAEVTADSSAEEIASTLLRAERSGIIDRRTADEILNGMKGQ